MTPPSAAPRIALTLAIAILPAGRAGADVLVRWEQASVPSRDVLGASTLAIPAGNADALRAAVERGFDVFVEVDAAALAGFEPTADRLAGIVIAGKPSPEDVARVRKRLASSGGRVFVLDSRGRWPHIRSNVVTARNEVLQVTSRTAQPWLEHNGALLRVAHRGGADPAPLLSYRWEPTTVSEKDEGPALEDYLLAIAEAGSFGGDLLLPLHERLQKSLLLGRPQAREWWSRIRRYIDFYAWDLPARYKPIATIGVVSADPARWLEMMRLLARHNLTFEAIAPDGLQAATLKPFRLVIALEPQAGPQLGALADYARSGGTLLVARGDGERPWHAAAPVVKTDERVSYAFGQGRVVEWLKRIADPNDFALEVRELLGREGRTLDVWNGITVLVAPYEEPERQTALLAALNYARGAQSIQVRVAGTYPVVEYESPEEPARLLPHTHRDGYTEFVVPALRVGARIFLSRQAGL